MSDGTRDMAGTVDPAATPAVEPELVILNLGCGGARPPAPFINVDTIIAEHFFAGPSVDALRGEANYREYNLIATPWPWGTNSVDGILASHFLEHFDLQNALRLVRECWRVLKPGGVLRVSVPNPDYFRDVFAEDCRANAERLFGEPIHDDSKQSFIDYALFFHQHKQTFGESGLWCLLANAGFNPALIQRRSPGTPALANEASSRMAEVDNRALFSLVMEATK